MARVALVGAIAGLHACGGGHVPPAAAPAPVRAAAGLPDATPRSLVLMLDGVPWAVIDSLVHAGHFRGFARPSLVVSTFPALTTVAFRDIWREPPAPGYEERWFDIAGNRLRGGAWDMLAAHGSGRGFHRHVDVEAGALVSGLAYALPVPLAQLELTGLRVDILERLRTLSDVVAYDATTDAVAHLAGRAALVTLLLRVEQLVDTVRVAYPGIRVDLLSDHGNDFVPSRQLPLEDVLGRAGLRLTTRLQRPGDVVVPRYGLVGTVPFYAAPADRAAIVRALVRAPGVDFVAWAEGGAILVESSAGRARIDADFATARFRYRAEAGDPLGFAHASERLRGVGELDLAGFGPDSAWLRESLATRYADGLRRLVRAWRGAVANPATVLVSLAPGAHFGDPAGDLLARMQGTHGSLRTPGSAAFFTSTRVAGPELIRSDHLLGYLPAPVRARVLPAGTALPAADPVHRPASGAAAMPAQTPAAPTPMPGRP